MHSMFALLLDRLNNSQMQRTGVIQWAAPIPAFGDVTNAQLATVGLNPSNREFVDHLGEELDGTNRRFHTLTSLDLSDWWQADAHHIRLMLDSCALYFQRNPYDTWFKRLEQIVSETSFSLYGSGACHLDLIPYATTQKWTELSSRQRTSLLELSTDALAILLSDSRIRVLILNGKSVVRHFEYMAGTRLHDEHMPAWSLPRRQGAVPGFSYRAVIDGLGGIAFAEPILVLGYNHNIQSSYGVTSEVVSSISSWVGDRVREHFTA